MLVYHVCLIQMVVAQQAMDRSHPHCCQGRMVGCCHKDTTLSQLKGPLDGQGMEAPWDQMTRVSSKLQLAFRCVSLLLYIHYSWVRGHTPKVVVLLYSHNLLQMLCKEVCPIVGRHNGMVLPSSQVTSWVKLHSAASFTTWAMDVKLPTFVRQ